MSAVGAQESAKKVQIADHILTQTYPLVKDPKLLLAVTQNLAAAIDGGVGALVQHLEEKKEIPPTAKNNAGRMLAFREHAMPKFNIPETIPRLLTELEETITEHKESPVEFVRDEKLVICDEGYRLRTLSPEKLKEQLATVKSFVTIVMRNCQ